MSVIDFEKFRSIPSEKLLATLPSSLNLNDITLKKTSSAVRTIDDQVSLVASAALSATVGTWARIWNHPAATPAAVASSGCSASRSSLAARWYWARSWETLVATTEEISRQSARTSPTWAAL